MPNDILIRDAQVRFAHMCSVFDSKQLVAYAVSQSLAPNMVAAQAALTGLLQWFACHDYQEEAASRQAILPGPVYDMHQAFVQNTTLYTQFCQNFLGTCVQLLKTTTAEQATFARQTGYLEETVGLLTEAFEHDLASPLLLWQQQLYDATVPIAAVSVMGHDVQKYQKITDLEHGTKTELRAGKQTGRRQKSF